MPSPFLRYAVPASLESLPKTSLFLAFTGKKLRFFYFRLTPLSRNYDDTLHVRSGSRELTIGLFAADRVWVRAVS